MAIINTKKYIAIIAPILPGQVKDDAKYDKEYWHPLVVRVVDDPLQGVLLLSRTGPFVLWRDLEVGVHPAVGLQYL